MSYSQGATPQKVPERLKEENQMEWVCRVQNVEARAREIVINTIAHR